MSNSLLQKSFHKLLCTEEGHEQEPLHYICISDQCQNTPVMCYLCSLEKHSDHEKIGLKVFFKQLLSLENKSEKVIPLCAQIDRVFDQAKRMLVNNSNDFVNPDLIMGTFYKFRSLTVKYAMDFYNLMNKVSELLDETQDHQKVKKLNDFIKNSYSKYFNEVQEDEWVKTNISEALLNKRIEGLKYILEALQKLQATRKINDNQVLNLFPLAIDQSRKIRVCFSEDLKPANMVLLSPTHAKMDKTGSQRLLILEPCLSKTISIKKWGVRIIKLASWIGVGVCHINEIKKASYMFHYSNTGHGNYLISSNGYSWSSYKKEFNSKYEPFTYTTGDVILLEYNPRQRIVKFKKESDSNQPTYEIEVEANDDPVHPEINLTGINDEVEIINF